MSLVVIVLVYLMILAWLSYKGYKETKTASDYLIAGRGTHPFVMALSYGAAFISTSAIVGMVFLLIFTFGKIGGVGDAHTKLDQIYKKATNANPIHQVQDVALQHDLNLSEQQAQILVQEFENIMILTKSITNTQVKIEKTKELLKNFQRQNPSLSLNNKEGLLFQKSSVFLAQKQALQSLEKQGHQGWNKMPKGGSPFWWLLVSSIILGVGIGVLAQPQLAVRFMTVKSKRELHRATLIGGVFILMMTGVAFVVGAFTNVWFFEQPQTKGLIALSAAGFNKDLIIPTFFNKALPSWFNLVLMLSLLSAAMSTLSSQFHAMGTAISRDILETSGAIKEGSGKKSILASKLGVGFMLIITVIVGYLMPEGYIAAGTALFFGLCAASFLPAYIGALYWKKATKKGALASIITGFVVSLFWLLFVHQFTLANWGGKSLFAGTQWAMVDPLLIGLPISTLVFVVVSLFSSTPKKEHVEACFKEITVK